MFDHLSTFNKVSVVLWVLAIVFFAPTVYRTWQGRRQDWMELGWLTGAAVMVATLLLRPDLTNVMITFVFFPLLVLSFLERRSRRE